MLRAAENEFITQTGPGTPMGDLFRRYWTPAFKDAAREALTARAGVAPASV